MWSAHPDAPSMPLNEVATQIQAQARSSNTCRIVLPPKPSKDALTLLLGNAYAMVVYLDEHIMERDAVAHRDLHLLPRWAVLHGIDQQMVQRLLDEPSIDGSDERLGRGANQKHMRLRSLSDTRHHPPYECHQVVELTTYLQLSSLNACHIQQCLGEHLQPLRRHAYFIDCIELPLAQGNTFAMSSVE